MADNNVVDLAAEFALDDRAKGFLQSVKALAAVAHLVRDVLATLTKAEQRALCQIMAARLEGAAALPASHSLAHSPLLIGMPVDHIVAVFESLVQNEVVQQLATGTNKKGEITSMAFRWPAFERLLLEGEEIAKGPRLMTPGGAPLRTP